MWQHEQFAMNRKPRFWVGQFHGYVQLLLLGGISFIAGCIPPQAQVSVSPTPTVSPSPSPLISPTPLPTAPTPEITPSPSPIPSPSLTSEKSPEVVAIENQVKQLVSASGDLTIQAVNCPANIREQAGSSYDCQVQSNIGAFVVVVQPTGQAGKFRWGTRGLLLVSRLAPLIEKNFETAGNGTVTVDCGAAVRTAKAGETFDCKVVDAAGAAKTARVTVRDDQGNVYVTPL